MRNGQSISYHQDKESAEKRARASNMRGGSNATVVKDERGGTTEAQGDIDVDSYADALIKRDKQNLSKSHVVHAARVAGVDHKKLMAAVNQKVGRIKEETLDELSKTTLKSYMNKADARTMDRTIDNPKAHKKAQNRTMGIEKAGKKVAEEIAVNSVGSGQVAGLQGEPPVRKKKKNVMSFNRFMKK
jgi:hypothetical protein